MSKRVRQTGQRIKYNYRQRALGFMHMIASCPVQFLSLFMSGTAWDNQDWHFHMCPHRPVVLAPGRCRPLSPPAHPRLQAWHKNKFVCCRARVVRKCLVFLRNPRLCCIAVTAVLTALAMLALIRGVRGSGEDGFNCSATSGPCRGGCGARLSFSKQREHPPSAGFSPEGFWHEKEQAGVDLNPLYHTPGACLHGY